MEIEIQLTDAPIPERISPPSSDALGAWLEFRGIVRNEEGGHTISGLEYEAYSEMAGREMRRILEALDRKFPCLTAKVIHRVGIIPVGETAIYVGLAASHRGEAIAALREFMDRLKQDVPIWKRRAIAAGAVRQASPPPMSLRQLPPMSLDEALAEISSRCGPLPAIPLPLPEAFGRTLRATVCASDDLPDCDRSTRDGYAILQDDPSDIFRVVDTLHAADWKPRQLKSGETVRIATGAALPCGNLRVVMQENIERQGDAVKIVGPCPDLNFRKRGEDVKAGQPLVESGARLDAGRLALLASGGCACPLVSPRLRIVHFTTGDEVVPPEQTPKPGQIRDSNSILLRGLLQKLPSELTQAHLPEDFDRARERISNFNSAVGQADLLLVSGGASVGETDFTRELLAWLGFDIIFSRVNIRPGAPLIFAMNGNRAAFGLPGNPLSHFVCYHLFVAAALAKFTGENPKGFLRAHLAAALHDALCPRDTLWPARLDTDGLRPLAWSSSGDVTCLGQANALIRVPANCISMEAGAEVEFLPA